MPRVNCAKLIDTRWDDGHFCCEGPSIHVLKRTFHPCGMTAGEVEVLECDDPQRRSRAKDARGHQEPTPCHLSFTCFVLQVADALGLSDAAWRTADRDAKGSLAQEARRCSLVGVAPDSADHVWHVVHYRCERVPACRRRAIARCSRPVLLQLLRIRMPARYVFSTFLKT